MKTQLSLLAVVILAIALAQKVESQDALIKAAPSPAPDHEAQDLFAAMRAGALEVRLIPKNDREARVLLRNKTKQALNVRLPDAFAGVPVLAQVARNGNANRNNNPSGNQAVGGGFGGGGGGLGGAGGGGLFAVPPERVLQWRVEIVCLEHGKRDPRPGARYEICALENVTSKPGVHDVLVQLAAGQVGQRSAQAAAWHLANDMSWETLAEKQIEHINAPSEPYFSTSEITGAIRLAEVAEHPTATGMDYSTAEAVSTANR